MWQIFNIFLNFGKKKTKKTLKSPQKFLKTSQQYKISKKKVVTHQH